MHDNSLEDILERKVNQLEAILTSMASLKDDDKNSTELRNLFESIPIPTFYKDTNGIYQQCNRAFAETIHGIKREQIVGKSVYDVANETSLDRAQLCDRKDLDMFENKQKQSYEQKVKWADGSERDYHFYRFPYMVDKQIVGLIGLMLDISNYTNMRRDIDKILALSI